MGSPKLQTIQKNFSEAMKEISKQNCIILKASQQKTKIKYLLLENFICIWNVNFRLNPPRMGEFKEKC